VVHDSLGTRFGSPTTGFLLAATLLLLDNATTSFGMPAPPLPKPIRRNPVVSAAPTSAQSDAPSEMTLGSLRVGHSGISFANPDDSGILPPIIVALDDLVFVRELGKGASGTVGLYKHKITGDKFAVKKINVTGKTSRDAVAGAAEVRNVFATPSPNAVRLFNAYIRDGHLLLLMEYMDGGNLEELLEKQPQLPEPAAAYVATQLLQALASLHRKQAGVDHSKEKKTVHRDIKPANVMLSKDGEIKIADFGVAGSADSIGLASFVGTATYMSPERIKGQRYGTESDIWSVGIVIAQLLLGRYPFKSVNGGFMALLKEVTTTHRLELPEADHFTPAAQDFLDMCLKQDSAQRETADTLLQHPWIVEAAVDYGGLKAFRTTLASVGISRQGSITSVLSGSTTSQPATPAGKPIPPTTTDVISPLP
jgi:serine/threonine protein kinase